MSNTTTPTTVDPEDMEAVIRRLTRTPYEELTAILESGAEWPLTVYSTFEELVSFLHKHGWTVQDAKAYQDELYGIVKK